MMNWLKHNTDLLFVMCPSLYIYGGNHESSWFVGVGRKAELADVRKPSPAAGQVVIKIGGAGVCHSDLHVMEEDLGFHAHFDIF